MSEVHLSLASFNCHAQIHNNKLYIYSLLTQKHIYVFILYTTRKNRLQLDKAKWVKNYKIMVIHFIFMFEEILINNIFVTVPLLIKAFQLI